LANTWALIDNPEQVVACLLKSGWNSVPFQKECMDWFPNAMPISPEDEPENEWIKHRLEPFFLKYNSVLNPLRFRGRTHPVIAHALRRKLLPYLQRTHPEFFGPRRKDCILIQRSSPFGKAFYTSRNIYNRDNLLARLSDYKPQVLFLEEMPVIEQCSAFYHADLIIAVHGAGMAHIIWADPDAVILGVVSPLIWHNTFLSVAHVAGLNYIGLLASAVHYDEPQSPKRLYRHSLEVDIDGILTIIEKANKPRP
jgi:hypothetical protein